MARSPSLRRWGCGLAQFGKMFKLLFLRRYVSSLFSCRLFSLTRVIDDLLMFCGHFLDLCEGGGSAFG